MYVIVGNRDNKADPRRWLYDGYNCQLLESEDDFNEARLFGWIHPSFHNLAAPLWKPIDWITRKGGQ